MTFLVLGRSFPLRRRQRPATSRYNQIIRRALVERIATCIGLRGKAQGGRPGGPWPAEELLALPWTRIGHAVKAMFAILAFLASRINLVARELAVGGARPAKTLAGLTGFGADMVPALAGEFGLCQRN